MATSVAAWLRASQAANDQLRAEIATQTRSLEVYQKMVTANSQLQAQVTSLTAQLNRVNSESMFSQDAYRGMQAQYDDSRVQHVNALNDREGLREQLRQSQSRSVQAEKRLTVLETEVDRLKRKMREAREGLDDIIL
jgi:chromosome segregation ATPase